LPNLARRQELKMEAQEKSHVKTALSRGGSWQPARAGAAGAGADSSAPNEGNHRDPQGILAVISPPAAAANSAPARRLTISEKRKCYPRT